MSGILERIVRRRRATASSRLGPPAEAGYSPPASPRHVNGTAIRNGGPLALPELNGHPQAEAQELDEASEPEPSALDQPAPVDEATEPPAEPEPHAEHETPHAEHETPASPPVQQSGAVEDPLPPSFRQRGRVRRRARYLRRVREIQLRDLGGFMVELRRFQRERPDLVEAKIESALRTDEELRTLERALGTEQPLRELREAGIGGVCSNCGAVHGSGDRYCSSCGETLSGRDDLDA